MKMLKVLIIIALNILWLANARADKILNFSAEQIQNLGIKTLQPTVVDSVLLASAPGSIVVPPANEYLVSAPLSGRVARINRAVGERVSKGAAIAVIDSSDFVGLQKDYLNDLGELNLAQATLRREKNLLSEGVISKRKWLVSKNQYDKRFRAVNEARQMLEISGLREPELRQLQRSGKLFKSLELKAPVDGVILGREVAIGQRVEKLAPMFRIANLDLLWLEATVPQQLATRIQIGDKLLVNDSDVSARVILIGSHVNPSDQTVMVRAAFDADAKYLRPGQKVSVRIQRTDQSSLLRVPVAAMTRMDNKRYVFVSTKDGFELREIKTVGSAGKYLSIENGIELRDQVVVKGVAALKAAFMGLGGE